MVEQRRSLFPVDPEAVADDVLGVVGAAASEHALDDDVLVDDERQHTVEGGVQVLQDVAEFLGLLDATGKAVEQESVRGVGLREPLPHHVVRDLRGDEVSGVDVLLGLQAERGALPDIGAEEIAGRDRGNAELLGQDCGLCAFAGTGRTEEYKSHLRNPS